MKSEGRTGVCCCVGTGLAKETVHNSKGARKTRDTGQKGMNRGNVTPIPSSCKNVLAIRIGNCCGSCTASELTTECSG